MYREEEAVDLPPLATPYTSEKESRLSSPHQTTPLLKAGRKIHEKSLLEH